MKKTLLLLATWLSIARAYDSPIKDKCLPIYDKGQSIMSTIDVLETAEKVATGILKKDIRFNIEASQKDLDYVSDAFTLCQDGKEFSFSPHELETSDMLAILLDIKAK